MAYDPNQFSRARQAIQSGMAPAAAPAASTWGGVMNAIGSAGQLAKDAGSKKTTTGGGSTTVAQDKLTVNKAQENLEKVRGLAGGGAAASTAPQNYAGIKAITPAASVAAMDANNAAAPSKPANPNAPSSAVFQGYSDPTSQPYNPGLNNPAGAGSLYGGQLQAPEQVTPTIVNPDWEQDKAMELMGRGGQPMGLVTGGGY